MQGTASHYWKWSNLYNTGWVILNRKKINCTWKVTQSGFMLSYFFLSTHSRKGHLFFLFCLWIQLFAQSSLPVCHRFLTWVDPYHDIQEFVAWREIISFTNCHWLKRIPPPWNIWDFTCKLILCLNNLKQFLKNVELWSHKFNPNFSWFMYSNTAHMPLKIKTAVIVFLSNEDLCYVDYNYVIVSYLTSIDHY